MDLDLEGNAALVTASSSGLGKASATALAREGADVIVNGRDEAKLSSAVADIEREATGEVVGRAADLTDPEDVRRLVSAATESFGRLDHLVTSGGGHRAAPFFELTDDDWYDAVDMHVMSVVRTVRAAGDALRDGGGTFVNISAHSVKEGQEHNVISSAVRMPGFHKVLSRELAPQVRANAVLPGPHDTPRMRAIFEDAVDRGEYGSTSAAREAATADIPAGQMGPPADLGNLVAYLSSPISGHLTGVAIPVDGGETRSNL